MTARATVSSGATFSPDRLYRYTLWREWGDGPPFVVIGLNPSTADESQDDPTIRRCVGFAKREGCGRLVMLNLFALRSTDPAALLQSTAPVGPENDDTLLRETREPNAIVVAAWGAHKTTGWRAIDVLTKLMVPLWCFGRTASGAPRHPLYVKADAPLLPLHAAPQRPGGVEERSG